MWSRYRLGVVHRVGRGIALFFHDRGIRRRWVVSSKHRPQFTPGKDPVPILQEAGWATGPVWTGGKSRPHRDSTPDRSQLLYWLSYPAHNYVSLLSILQITYYRMSGLLPENKLEIMYRKAFVAQLGAIVWRGPENSRETSFKMPKLLGEIWTQNLPRTEWECYLDLKVLSEFLIS